MKDVFGKIFNKPEIIYLYCCSFIFSHFSTDKGGLWEEVQQGGKRIYELRGFGAEDNNL